MTHERVERVVAALGREDRSPADVVVPLMRHTFAREYGWPYGETDALTLKQAHQALVLIGEDISRRNKEWTTP